MIVKMMRWPWAAGKALAFTFVPGRVKAYPWEEIVWISEDRPKRSRKYRPRGGHGEIRHKPEDIFVIGLATVRRGRF
jgi:hypothetical protein